MAVYNITLSDGVTIISIPDGSVDLTSADIPLVGQNAQLYGDDIARAQLFMLENFASITEPSINPLIGQLWYDTANNNINVYNGVTFDPMAPLAQGTVQNAMLRFDGTDTWLEETQLQLSSSGVLSVFDVGLSNSATISHDGTYLNLDAGMGTTDAVRINNTDLFIMDGMRLSFMPGGPEQFEICHDGTDVNFQFVAGGELLITQPTNVRINSVIALQDKAASPADVAGYGQLWVRNDTPNILVFTDDTGTDFDLNAAAGAADHGGLVGLGDDDHMQYAEIANTETISSVWTYTARPAFNSAGAPMTVVNNTLVTNLNADQVDGIEGTALALDANVVKLTGAQSISGTKTFENSSVIADLGGSGPGLDVGSVGFKIEGGSNTQSANSGFFSTYFQNGVQEQFRCGTDVGSSWSEVRATLGDLNLYAANTLVFNIDPTQTTITQSGGTAMNWHTVSGTNTTTTAGVFDSGGATERNVGYNETPTVTQNSSTTIDRNDIGKLMTRTTSTSRTWTLSADTNIPIGGSLLVHNDHSSNTLTIATTQTLQWIDGTGSAATGNRTLAYNSIATVRKKSSTIWQIWGNGIS